MVCYASIQKFMRKLILLFTLCYVSTQLSAQVKGSVIDSANSKPMESAVVALVTESHKSDTSYTLTNERGEFSFTGIPVSNFTIIITSVGYTTGRKFRRLYGSEKIIDMGSFSLANRSTILDEIVIQSAPISIKQDTVEYRADAFKVKENGVVEDLLKKLPGIQVDKDGNIKAQGKAVTKVKVNGKDFFGGDPKTATKELPANIVDKVQIVDDYGDQATISGIKDGVPERVMNIQLKKNKNTGYFGRVTTGMGTEGRYQATLTGNYFRDKQQISFFSSSNNTSQSAGGGSNRGMGNGRSGPDAAAGSGLAGNTVNNGDLQLSQNSLSGSDGVTITNSIGVNYRDEWSPKINVYGSYTYTERNNSGYKISSQQNIFSSGTFFNNQNNVFENLGTTHRFLFNIEYNIDSFNFLKISPSISVTNNRGNSNTVFDYFTATSKTSEGFNNWITHSRAPNLSGSILFNHKFRKRGRNFSLNLNGGSSQSYSEQDSKNSTIQYLTPVTSSNLFLFNTQQNNNYNYGLRMTYTEPLSRVRFLDLSFSQNLSYARNDKRVYNTDPPTGIQLINPGLSNDYENTYFNNRINVSVRTSEKKYNYTVGLSIQPVNLRGASVTKDSAYKPILRTNIFPIARLSYNFSKTKSLNINYRGDAQQPGFAQLQDVIDSSNRQYQVKGNPDLKPSANHSLHLFYNNFNFITGRVLFTSLTFNTIKNKIVNNTVRLGTTGAQITTPQNVNGYYNVTGFYNYSIPYNNRQFILSLNGYLNLNHNVNLVDSLKNIGENWIASQGFNFEYNHKDWLELTIGTNYNMNSVTYKNRTIHQPHLQNDKYSSWIFTSNVNIDFPKGLIFKYDLEYTINRGLTEIVGRNMTIMNASIEKQLFKTKNGNIRLQALDILNQSSNITRSISSNSIIDSRSNRLSRYFMLTFTYRLQKFNGKRSAPKSIGKILRVE